MNNEHFIPANITAKRVISKGVHYNYEVKGTYYHSENPLIIEKIKLTKSPQFQDFTGQKHGKFTIVGLVKAENLKDKGKNYKAKWLVRCVCGEYETRTSSAIKNHKNNPGKYDLDQCSKCYDLQKIRITATAKSMGYSYVEYCEKFFPRK